MNPDLERLVGRAVIEKAFRDKLLADPEAAVKDSGLALSAEELDNLKAGVERVKLNLSTEQIDQQLGPALSW